MAPETRDAERVLHKTRALVDERLRLAAQKLPTLAQEITSYHFGWEDAVPRPGKAFRPALALLCAEAAGGDARAALPAAVAVELVHNSSLLYDDVLDADPLRRQRPAGWKVFGPKAAIVTGGLLMTLAFDVLATDASGANDSAGIFSDALLHLGAGQLMDVDAERHSETDMRACLAMSRAKTGALIGCACALGAARGGGTAQQIGDFREFGEHLGLAFQLVDDIAGIWGDPAQSGKQARSDLRNRKKSPPVVAALTSSTSAGRELAALYEQSEPLTDSDLDRAAHLIDAAGGRSAAREVFDESLARALRHLDAAHPAPRPRAELRSLAFFLTRVTD
jgi:geranylgeranyl diphosphate synthase, type I